MQSAAVDFNPKAAHPHWCAWPYTFDLLGALDRAGDCDPSPALAILRKRMRANENIGKPTHHQISS
jgi:hypothetical protein